MNPPRVHARGVFLFSRPRRVRPTVERIIHPRVYTRGIKIRKVKDGTKRQTSTAT